MADEEFHDARIAEAETIVRGFESMRWKLKQLSGELRAARERIQMFEEGSKSTGQERMRLLRQIWAVENLHSEAQEVVCGDGCCHEGQGWCSYCGDADKPVWPCQTIAALHKAEASDG